MNKHYNIPIFIPELACHYKCIYCNQRKISGMKEIPASNDIVNTIEKYLNTIDYKNSEVEIGFFGGSFTGLSLDKQEELLVLTKPYIDNQMVQSIRLSTRPDYINEENLELLLKYNVKTIELGAQSMDDEVLKYSGRGHTAEVVRQASKMIKAHGFNLGLQMMIGLPMDTHQKAITTAKEIINLGADNTRIYPTLVIKNTPLEDLYNKGEYIPLNMDEAVSIVKDLVLLFEAANVNILRIGLHPSEGLLNGNDLVAGPFHPSFKELVMAEVWKDNFNELFNMNNKDKKLTIFVPAKAFNFAIGYFGSNKKQLEKYYKQVNFKIDELLEANKFYVDYN